MGFVIEDGSKDFCLSIKRHSVFIKVLVRSRCLFFFSEGKSTYKLLLTALPAIESTT